LLSAFAVDSLEFKELKFIQNSILGSFLGK